MTTGGSSALYATSGTAAPFAIKTGPNGNIWYTGMSGTQDRIGKLTPCPSE